MMNIGSRPWKKNETWELVPIPKDKNVISTKWVFINKLNEYGPYGLSVSPTQILLWNKTFISILIFFVWL
jgi:hypothetical protein